MSSLLTVGLLLSPLNTSIAKADSNSTGTQAKVATLPIFSGPNPQLVPLPKQPDFDKDVLPKLRAAQQAAADHLKALTDDCNSKGGTLDGENCVVPPPPPEPVQSPIAYYQPSVMYHAGGGPNAYAYGYCTYYVKSRRPDFGSYWGDASNWPYAAQADGFAIGYSPQVGAGAVMKGVNHVAYVESINGDGTITVSEMNYAGNWNTVTSRVASASDFIYIY